MKNSLKHIGDIAKYLQVQRTIMKEKGCSPSEIARMSIKVCKTYGVPVPEGLEADNSDDEELHSLCIYEYNANLALPERAFTDLLKRVYIVEYGEYIKIGFTKNMKKRMKELQNIAQNYSNRSLHRVAWTDLHTNYSQNENNLHLLFNDRRIVTGELFDISFEKAFEALKALNLEDNSISRLNKNIPITEVFS